jgi:hypothetical protein
MLYQWQLVKSKVIQSNFPGNFHDKISLRISLLQEELKNVAYNLEFQKVPPAYQSSPPLAPVALGSQFSPYFIN